jgi:chromate transporter
MLHSAHSGRGHADVNATPPHPDASPPSFSEATAVWARIGLLSFGGPAGQIALMHRELVDERGWIDEARFLHALNFCMLLPGPEAQQLATYIGWALHGWRGGLVAGLLFVLPGLACILALSAAYGLFSDTGWLDAVFFGLKAAVLVIVVEATLRMGRRALKTRLSLALAVGAFIALFVFSLPFPLVVLGAGLIGLVAARNAGAGDIPTTAAPIGWRSTLATVLRWTLVWFAPLLPLVLIFGPDSVFVALFGFFSQMAVVSFGGAYAVLAYVAQEAVQGFGWLQPAEMIDGLALAETTPGPLVLVLSFVGFLAGLRAGDGLWPLAAGLLGGVVTAWATFAPSFLWIFAGAPHIDRLRGNRVLAGALAAITAAVVGVILNLALWFGLHVVFAEVGSHTFGAITLPVPVLETLDPLALVFVAMAALSLFVLRLGVPWTLSILAGLGLLARLVGLGGA